MLGISCGPRFQVADQVRKASLAFLHVGVLAAQGVLFLGQPACVLRKHAINPGVRGRIFADLGKRPRVGNLQGVVARKAGCQLLLESQGLLGLPGGPEIGHALVEPGLHLLEVSGLALVDRPQLIEKQQHLVGFQ